MSYTALYRKFRPQAFEDVKGQEHIVTTLKNQIKQREWDMHICFVGLEGQVRQPLPKFLPRLSTVKIL